MTKLNILAIPGSLRQASLHRELVRQLQPLAPDDMQIDIFELHDIPVYNSDVEQKGFPASVQTMRDKIEASDGIIFATPEYNGAMSGVIKNGIDWASRKRLLRAVPVTIISGSSGSLGATKAQESLRAVVTHLGMHLMARPSLAIPKLNDKLVDGHLDDERTNKFIREWLESFRDWVVLLKK